MSRWQELRMRLARRFARVVTNAVVRRPALWRVFRRPFERLFDRLASRWDEIRMAGHLDSFERALEAIERPPRRVLDVGTGTGTGALAIANRWPESDVLGVDLAAGMVTAARHKLPHELADRVRFEQGDASALPYADASFDLVALANMIPFFDELARLVCPGGYALFAFSDGAETPIFVPPERLRRELAARGFADFAEFAASPGTALLARKASAE